MSTKSRVVLAVALVAASLSLVGCAAAAGEVAGSATSESPSQTPGPTPTLSEGELLGWKQMAAANPNMLGPGEGEVEYAQARREFPLEMPEGTAIPQTTAFNFYAPGGIYERGMGYGLVSWTWLCATETELLDAIEKGDNERADASIAQIDLWVALPSNVRMLEGVESFRSAVIDPARVGDTAALEADRQSWCAQAPFETN